MLVCLLLVSAFVAALGEQVPCLNTRDQCQGTMSGMSIINNNYYCCARGYSMSMRGNNQCTCTKTSEIAPCGKGPNACRQASSRVSDGQGNTICCQAGFSMQRVNGIINGQYTDDCTCSRPLGGVQIIGGNGVVTDSDFNATVFEERMEEFSNTLENSMQSLSDRLENMLNNLFKR